MAMRQDVTHEPPTPAGSPPAIACAGLTKDYGQGRGVFDLGLTVGRGETFGLIGPDGAGKTTTIRLLMNLAQPTRGHVTVLGRRGGHRSLEIWRQVGYLPGELPQFPGVSAGYAIRLLAGLRGGVDPQRITALAARFGLDLRRDYQDLCPGEKREAGLIQAFMHWPEVLILDEPAIGLDPPMQREFRLLVQESAARGATIFLSSRLLSEVELSCDRIGLIRGGRLLWVGSLADFRSLRIHRVEAVFAGSLTAAQIGRLPGVTDLTIDDHHLTCAVRGSVAPLLTTLFGAGVIEIDSQELSLEEMLRTEAESTA